MKKKAYRAALRRMTREMKSLSGPKKAHHRRKVFNLKFNHVIEHGSALR